MRSIFDFKQSTATVDRDRLIVHIRRTSGELRLPSLYFQFIIDVSPLIGNTVVCKNQRVLLGRCLCVL